MATFNDSLNKVTIKSNPGNTEKSSGLKTYNATKIITNAPVIFMTKNISIRKVGMGNNITPRINITAIPNMVLLLVPNMEANLVFSLLAICHGSAYIWILFL